MPGYQHPCRYCQQFIPPDASYCPICGKKNPLGPLRCPKCQAPIAKGWVRCTSCGLSLEIDCPHCKAQTFFGDYCEHCGSELLVVCSHCKTPQLPTETTCSKCKKRLLRRE